MSSLTKAQSTVPRRAAPTVRRSLVGVPLLLVLIASAGVDRGFAADGTAAQRLTCMLGEAPGKIGQDRAADTCIAALVHTARDRHLPDLYRVLLAQLGGDARLIDKLPLAIGNAVLDGDGKVQIGNGKVMEVVPSSLAFDAGFTAAYLDGAEKFVDEGPRDPAKLKLLAESCLGVKKDAGPCFSAGFMYGAQAFRARKASSD